MSSIVVRGLTKVFGSGAVAVRGIDLEIAEGEMVAILGPSGCGKTTTLRCIAGLEQPTAGEIYLGDQLVCAPQRKVFVPPEARNVGMVFQSYALWPHMTVFENVAFPLRMRRVPGPEIRERVLWALQLTRMEAYADRYPAQLSGGQQQRVALSRAVASHPRVLLFDEPLSNLDARLRDEVRFEIRRLQRELRTTAVYVTHDQAEAMVIADRIVVMRDGRVVQVGTPEEIYESPADEFVASFVGDVNRLQAEVVEAGGEWLLVRSDTGMTLKIAGPRNVHPPGSRVTCLVRPENVQLVADGHRDGEGGWPGVIDQRNYLGSVVEYQVRVGQWTLRARCQPRLRLDVGSRVRVQVAPDAWVVLAAQRAAEGGGGQAQPA